MITKSVTYTNFFGEKKTKEYTFHLSEQELIDLQLTTEGGLDSLINKAVETHDEGSLIKIFKELVLKSYGEISADGDRFIKSEELSKAFSQSAAFNTMITDMLLSDTEASDFINGIIPNVDEIKSKIEAKNAQLAVASDK